MVVEAITAPYRGFCEGARRMAFYAIQEDGDRILLAFEPWFLESRQAGDFPCLRMVFRRIGDRVVLERFAVCDGAQERLVDLEAAHDALQIWLDYLSE